MVSLRKEYAWILLYVLHFNIWYKVCQYILSEYFKTENILFKYVTFFLFTYVLIKTRNILNSYPRTFTHL